MKSSQLLNNLASQELRYAPHPHHHHPDDTRAASSSSFFWKYDATLHELKQYRIELPADISIFGRNLCLLIKAAYACNASQSLTRLEFQPQDILLSK